SESAPYGLRGPCPMVRPRNTVRTPRFGTSPSSDPGLHELFRAPHEPKGTKASQGDQKNDLSKIGRAGESGGGESARAASGEDVGRALLGGLPIEHGSAGSRGRQEVRGHGRAKAGLAEPSLEEQVVGPAVGSGAVLGAAAEGAVGIKSGVESPAVGVAEGEA